LTGPDPATTYTYQIQKITDSNGCTNSGDKTIDVVGFKSLKQVQNTIFLIPMVFK
jgi:hypothetical protein